MPFNPNLFPTEFTNICPNTQLEETDPLTELRQQILQLRNQHLLQSRKTGVSIAELQNQGIRIVYQQIQGQSAVSITNIYNPPPVVPTPPAAPVTTPPTAPPSAPAPGVSNAATTGKCFCGGGRAESLHGNVDKFSTQTERKTVISWDLAQRRKRHAGFASSRRGYWAGGQTGLVASSRVNTIEGVDLALETRVAVGSLLSASLVYCRAVSAADKSYIAGNWTPNTGVVNSFNHATEVRTTLGSSLANAVGGLNAVISPSTAYFASGWNLSRTIDTISISGDTFGSLGTQLSVVRMRAGNFSTPTEGIFSGGYTGTGMVATQDVLRFADNTLSVSNRTMLAAENDCEGFSSYQKGYLFGGTATTIRIRDIHFGSKTWQFTGVALSVGGSYPVAVGKA